jgi:hypothetical protein
MKYSWKNTLLLLSIAVNSALQGYAISHNEDSELDEVTIFVFTSEDDFKKMLENQGVSKKILNNISTVLPKITAGGSFAATALGNPELVPLIAAIGGGLAAASKYAVGPARWVMEKKYNTAIHKHTKRGNKGKDAEWNWADIQKDLNIEPTNPYGLFTVFLHPETKQVLLMSPMKTNEAFGFKAIKDSATGKFKGIRAPFERNLKEEAEKNLSAVARLYAYAKNRYDNPHKILWDIKDSFNSAKDKLSAFTKKYPGLTNKMEFLDAQMDELKEKITNYDSTSGKQDAQDLIAFFKREIEESKKIAQDPEAKELVNRVIKKFNLFKKALTDIVIKPAAGYTAGMKKLAEESEKQIEAELESFTDIAGDDIVPLPNPGLPENLND